MALKQTLETLLIGKTVKSFQLLKDVNPEVEKDLCAASTLPTWLRAYSTIGDRESILINDPDTLAELQKSM